METDGVGGEDEVFIVLFTLKLRFKRFLSLLLGDCELVLVSVGDKGSCANDELTGVKGGEGVSVSTFKRGDSLPGDERPPTDEIDCIESDGEDDGGCTDAAVPTMVAAVVAVAAAAIAGNLLKRTHSLPRTLVNGQHDDDDRPPDEEANHSHDVPHDDDDGDGSGDDDVDVTVDEFSVYEDHQTKECLRGAASNRGNKTCSNKGFGAFKSTYKEHGSFTCRSNAVVFYFSQKKLSVVQRVDLYKRAMEYEFELSISNLTNGMMAVHHYISKIIACHPYHHEYAKRFD
uniref:Uncharacterized protein n=1 Tax=Glossina brevipalpis TaxID=37001 RepID=A0A1A9X283_9MUSC